MFNDFKKPSEYVLSKYIPLSENIRHLLLQAAEELPKLKALKVIISVMEGNIKKAVKLYWQEQSEEDRTKQPFDEALKYYRQKGDLPKYITKKLEVAQLQMTLEAGLVLLVQRYFILMFLKIKITSLEDLIPSLDKEFIPREILNPISLIARCEYFFEISSRIYKNCMISIMMNVYDRFAHPMQLLKNISSLKVYFNMFINIYELNSEDRGFTRILMIPKKETLAPSSARKARACDSSSKTQIKLSPIKTEEELLKEMERIDVVVRFFARAIGSLKGSAAIAKRMFESDELSFSDIIKYTKLSRKQLSFIGIVE